MSTSIRTLRSRTRVKRAMGTALEVAFLGRPDPKTLKDGLGRYYVRVSIGGILQVSAPLRMGAGVSFSPLYNMPVLIGFDPSGQRVITGIAPVEFRTLGLDQSITNIADPANTQIRDGNMLSFLCRSASRDCSANTAEVQPGNAVIDGSAVVWAGGATDFVASLPTSGNHQYGIVGLSSLGALVIATSTEQATSIPLDLSDLQEAIDALGVGVMLIKAFQMSFGETCLTSDPTKQVDLRLFGESVSSSVPNELESFAFFMGT